jgi:cytidylate kinase
MAVITISRQFGAGGKTLALKLTEALNYEIAHEVIIEQLAEKAKLSEDGVRAFEVEEEVDSSQSSATVSSGRKFMDRIFETQRKYMDGQTYLKLLYEIVPKVAEQDNIIILGRGSQFILKDRPNTYHVLLVAEYQDRVKFMQQQYGLSEEEARQAVDKQSKRRLKLMKVFHSEDYDQPVHYNLVVNMSKVNMNQALEIVTELVKS